MLTTLKPKKKRKPLKSILLKNVRMVVTLSDRLKQAGIKECDPNHEEKGSENLNKLSKTRKNNKGYSEKHAKAGLKSTIKPLKKPRGLHKEFILPYLKDSNQNKILRKDVQLKNPEALSEDLKQKSEGSENQTIYVSLDFIKDCQKYKSKFRNPKGDSEYHQKNLKFFTNKEKQYPYTNEESEKLFEVSQIRSCGDTQIEENLIARDILNEKHEKGNLTMDDELKSQPERKFSPIQDYFDPSSVPEVAKIDRKYLDSLLSIANSMEEGKTNTKQGKYNNNEKAENVNQSSKKKKITGKDFFENKRKNKEWEEKVSKNGIENTGAIAEIQKNSTSISGSSYKNCISVRILRESTKSEVQIKLRKENSKQRGSEMKSEKNVAQSKPKVNETNRKRKTKNIILRNRNEKFFEIPFSGEVSKVADVKELWRREANEKSENSLSSHSSSTIPETDEHPEWKSLGLESYKILERLVEEEVKKIAKISVNKNKMGDINDRINFNINESKTENSKEPEKPKNECQKLQVLKSNLTKACDVKNHNDNILKKSLKENERQQYYSTYEGEKPKAQLLSLFAEDELENSKSKLKLLRERESISSKIPGQIIQNWSILNRLEQAFLALGTPTFPNKDFKGLNSIKGKNPFGSEKNTTNSETSEKKSIDKKLRKIRPSKECLGLYEARDSVNVWCSSPETSTKITIQNFQNKDKSSCSRQIIKNKHAENCFRKESKNESLKNNTILLKISENKENHPGQKITEFQKPTTGKVLGKSKLNDNKTWNLKKKNADIKFLPNDFKQAKTIKTSKKKSLLMQGVTSEEVLEGKNIFKNIAVNNHSKVQPRKSKSCTKIDENTDFDIVKKRFLPKKNQELSLCQENVKENPKSRSRSTDTDTDIITKSKAMHSLRKSLIKETSPMQSEKLRYASEKGRKIQENSLKLPKTKFFQENRLDKIVTPEEHPDQTLEKKNLHKVNLNERAIKERSILSIRGNQIRPQISTNMLTRIQKPAPDFSLGFKSNTEDFQMKTTIKADFFQASQSNLNNVHSSVSCTSTETYELHDFDPQVCDVDKPIEVNVSDCQKYLSDISEMLTSLSSLSISVYSDQKNELKQKECHSLWEQDIHHYHAIVKEIMSQYNRLDGFLKQSEASENFPGCDSIKLMLAKDNSNDEANKILDNSQDVDIQEYRKKIMLEYKKLPFFEYKAKLQQNKKSFMPEETKKKLSVVKNFKTEVDLDVKDYQPKIQKVLGSQLYVDVENLAKRNCPNEKCKEKKSSLQEIILSKNEKTVQQEECIRTSSMPKAFLQLQDSFILSDSSQKIKTTGSSQGDFSSVFTSSTYLEDTESETQ